MKQNLLKLFALAMVLPFAFVGCDDDVLDGVDTGKLAVQFKAADAPSVRSSIENETRSLSFDDLLNVTSFKINVAEIEFDFDDDDDLAYKFGGSFSYDDDVKLRGPFEVDLISNGTLQVETLFTGLEIPRARFEEIEFDMKKNRNKNSPMFGQTVRVEGTVMGIPFIFASDKEFDFEVEFDRPFVVDNNSVVAVNFYVNRLFSKAISGIDFTQAIDHNKNGIIEIYYNDDDNKSYNYQLGKRIWDLLDDIIDCDDFDDDDDD